MKVLLLGGNGMLGSYIKAFFKHKTNHELKALDIRKENIANHIADYDVLINCVGIIKPRVNKIGPVETIKINSLLPWELQELCLNHDKQMIHISTDCVFSGKVDGAYSEESPPDATDLYGKSKYLGEIDQLTVIRTSIIGEELKNKYSLIEWVKSSGGKKINGYTNHHWSGVTCLKLAEFINKMITTKNYWKGVRHVHSNTVDKFELVSDIVAAFNLNVEVNAVADANYCNRALKSIHDNQIVDGSIRSQLFDLNNFSPLLKL